MGRHHHRDDEEDTTAVFAVDQGLSARATAARRDRASLTVLSGSSIGTIARLDRDPFVIGRAADCALVLEDDGISRRHAELRSAGSEWVLVDLGSKNGTFANGVSVRERLLRPGDRIQLGRATIVQFSLADELEDHVQQSLLDSATRDALTGLANRRSFDERIVAEFSFAVRHGAPLGIVMADVDHFRDVNTRLGHLAGDAALRYLGAAIRKTIRAEDFAARYGGEEFVVLVRNLDARNLALFADRLRRVVERMTIPWESIEIGVTISLGLSMIDASTPVESPMALLQRADDNLYRAKSGGRNRVVGT